LNSDNNAGAQAEPTRRKWALWRRAVHVSPDEALRDFLAVARGALGNGFLKGFSMTLAFVTSVLLARILGAADFGTYSFAVSWALLLSVPAVFGLDQLIVRELARAPGADNESARRDLMAWSMRAVLVASIATMAFASVIIGLAIDTFQQKTATALIFAVLCVPLIASMRIRQEALRGLGRVVVGQVPELLVRPIALLVLLGILTLANRTQMSLSSALIATIAAYGTALAASQWLLRPPFRYTNPSRVARQRRVWLTSSLPLLAVATVQIANAQIPIIVLGFVSARESIGVYVAANRGALLISLVLLAATVALAPTLARAYSQGERSRLQFIMTRSAQATLLIALPIAVALMAFSDFYFTLFGPEFASGVTALRILSIGQLISVAAGPVALVLVMSGHEKDTLFAMVGAAAITLSLSLALVPAFDVSGAAVAAALGVLFWNLVMTVRVYQRVKILPTAFAKATRLRAQS